MNTPWWRVVCYELKTIFTDFRVLTIMLGGPFLYAVLFGGVYYYGRVHKVPMLVIDQDNSQLSRDLITAALASDNLSLAGYGRNVDDFTTATRRGTAYLALVIPEDFQRDLQRGHQAKVLVLADGSNVLIANVAYRSLRSLFGTYRVGARSKRLMAGGVPHSAALQNALPIQAEVRPLFNPAYNYSSFILVGLICIALQQVTMLGAAICLGLDCDQRRRRELRAISNSPFTVMLGKLAAHSLLMIPLGMLAIYLPFGLFGVSFHGHLSLLLGTTALFIIIQVLAGLGVGGMCKNPLLATQLLLCVSTPLFTIAGVTWPLLAMPQAVQYAAYALPLTHFALLARKFNLMGAPLPYVWPQILGITAWLPIAGVWAYWAVRSLLRPEQRK